MHNAGCWLIGRSIHPSHSYTTRDTGHPGIFVIRLGSAEAGRKHPSTTTMQKNQLGRSQGAFPFPVSTCLLSLLASA